MTCLATTANENIPDLQHAVMGVTLNGEHCMCPKNSGAKRVLDLGTGSGIWAIEYGELSIDHRCRSMLIP